MTTQTIDQPVSGEALPLADRASRDARMQRIINTMKQHKCRFVEALAILNGADPRKAAKIQSSVLVTP